MNRLPTLLWWATLIGLAAIVADQLAGGTGAVFGALVAAVVLLGLQLRQLERLERWLAAPDEQVPEGSGAWEDVFARLARLQKNHRAALTRLERAVKTFESAGQAIPEGVLAIDAEQRIVWMNRLGARHFGLDMQRDREFLVTQLIRDPAFRNYLQQGDFAEPLLMHPTHRPDLALQVFVVAFAGEQTLILSRDISDREQLERMRRDFVANVSHELRTPLTVVSGFVETLSDLGGTAGESLPQILPLLENQTRRMQSLVTDLLTLARLECERDEPPMQAIGMQPLLQALVKDAEVLSAGRHQIITDIDPGLELLGADGEIRSILSNLLSNAVRYSSAGTIKVSWHACAEGACFTVRDTGPGIAPEHIPRLTERFYRVDSDRSRASGGTGLGLAIVKHALTRHGGQLRIDSTPGVGSTFAAVFPAARIGAAPTMGAPLKRSGRR